MGCVQSTPFIQAIENGDVATVRELLQSGSHPDSETFDGMTSLLYACGCKFVRGYRKKFNNWFGADADFAARIKQYSARRPPCRADIVEALVGAGADVNAQDGRFLLTPLNCAAFLGHIDVVQFLLSHGANVNAGDNEGTTALIYASIGNNVTTMDVLLKHGADIEARNSGGDTALQMAVFMGNGAAVDKLLSNGADVNSKNNDGQNASFTAASVVVDASIMQILIKYGVELNYRNGIGATPLISALAEGQPHVADVMLSSGRDLDIDAVTIQGYTALSLAQIQGMNNIANKIVNYGANWQLNDTKEFMSPNAKHANVAKATGSGSGSDGVSLAQGTKIAANVVSIMADLNS